MCNQVASFARLSFYVMLTPLFQKPHVGQNLLEYTLYVKQEKETYKKVTNITYEKMPSVHNSVYKKATPTVPKLSKYLLVFDNKTIK